MAEVVISNNKQTTCGVAIPTKTFKSVVEFKCEKTDIYRALTEREMVQAFTRSPVTKFDVEKGGQFVLFGGSVLGEFVEIVCINILAIFISHIN